MIGFQQGLPSLTWWNNGQFPISREWLISSLRQAAKKAGRPNWGMEEDFVASVTKYLEEDYGHSTIGVWQLEQMVITSLRTVGEYEVANCCKLIPPLLVISLPEIAAYAHGELMFFQMLREHLQKALHQETVRIKLEGMRQAVKQLAKRLRWRKRCIEIEKEIYSFLSLLFSQTSKEIKLIIA
ncbi:MAG: hypothetical protein RML49_07355 [Verrucomicrobiae bacterium]|nr:hypothetical protein [Verrucomicrobiae bacterium]